MVVVIVAAGEIGHAADRGETRSQRQGATRVELAVWRGAATSGQGGRESEGCKQAHGWDLPIAQPRLHLRRGDVGSVSKQGRFVPECFGPVRAREAAQSMVVSSSADTRNGAAFRRARFCVRDFIRKKAVDLTKMEHALGMVIYISHAGGGQTRSRALRRPVPGSNGDRRDGAVFRMFRTTDFFT
jgi:hypothetical protein